ncbi:DUF2510 domain-containing protein [Homoserinimonas hongtaonis]|uniref:DUF2510 domain-containing protein n=1 Tax=Homoserinimonas hongtaonis TaxID=2079791 RepID=UPI000D3B3D3E|nr:DUF2510 domain-containing protein [Salinibacterium hongtaonis]AWB89876.1 hypothetical protein C2138_10320 [Salinibacterium hongtaonis]
MTEPQNSAAPAGWYVDPITRRHLRWWNGLAWTESVAPLPGVEPAAAVAPAPRVQQRFALQASDDQTQAAAAHTQVQAERFTQPAQQFVTQVPNYVAQRVEPTAEPTLSVAPTIPWPAMQNGAQSAAAQPVGHYTPQYADALSILGSLPLDDANDDEGVDDPAPERSPFAPTTASDTDPISSLPVAAAPPVSATDSRSEAVKSAAARLEAEWAAQLADQAQRDREAAHFALAAQADAAHARAQAHLAESLAAATAQAQQVQAQQVQAQQAQHAQAPDSTALDTTALDDSIESTLMSRRRLRDGGTGPVASSGAPTSRASVAVADDDIWAGPGDRRGEASWSPVGNGRVAELNNRIPERWSTASVWLLTLTPWLWGLALFVTLSLFAPWSLPAIGVLALPWLVGLLFAQQDAARLRDFGHAHPPSPAWALLTAPVYLVLRTLMLRRTLGAGSAPLIVWAINAALLVSILAAAALMPEILPSYVIDTLEPLRETAKDWAGR